MIAKLVGQTCLTTMAFVGIAVVTHFLLREQTLQEALTNGFLVGLYVSAISAYMRFRELG